MAVSAPNAVTQLLAIATAALPSNFQVVYATNWGPYVAPQALLVNKIHFLEDEYAEIAPTYKHEEHYNLLCQLCSAGGDANEQNRMTEVYGYYVDVQTAIANNPTLNGAVRLAWPRQLDYDPTKDAKGWSLGVLTFEVYCEQRVTSLT